MTAHDALVGSVYGLSSFVRKLCDVARTRSQTLPSRQYLRGRDRYQATWLDDRRHHLLADAVWIIWRSGTPHVEVLLFIVVLVCFCRSCPHDTTVELLRFRYGRQIGPSCWAVEVNGWREGDAIFQYLLGVDR